MFGGFLIYLKDSSGKWRKNPGFYTGGTNKEQIFNAIRDYIQRRGYADRHIELMEDCKNIQNVKQMTKYDRFTAAGLAEIACNINMGVYLRADEQEEDTEFPFDERSFE